MYSNVPDVLKQIPHWVVWKLITIPGMENPKKIPFTTIGTQASSIDINTWASFESVCNITPTPTHGIGFVFTKECGLLGIDLDHAILENKDINPKFKDILTHLKTYTEISPSKTGLHLILKCSNSPYNMGHHKNDLGIFTDKRYFTVTGIQYPGTPNEIIEYPSELIQKICSPFLTSEKKTIMPKNLTIRAQLSDNEITDIISHSSNFDKFDRLYNSGSISEYNNDHSAADMALASILAFYTRDPNQIERIMRNSSLVREKWDNHKTYLRDITISKAISGCTGYYEPRGRDEIIHGMEITTTLLSSDKTKKELPSKDEILKIKKMFKLHDNLPQLPEITHPLFKKWVDVGGRLMYSHKSYHFGNLLPIASMTLGKRVGLLISTKFTHTNCNVMLVGTSTISGKSFSSDIAIKEFGVAVTNIPTCLNPEDNTILKRKSCSNPRLVQDISKINNMLWYYDEAKEFFDECQERGWNAPIVNNLCTAYDEGPLEIARSNKTNKQTDPDNKWVCEQPFLSLLFNMTTSQLKEASTPKIVGSGFLFRWMWFIENGGERKKNITASNTDLKEISEIKNELIRVGTILKKLRPNDICFKVNDRIEQWSIDISKKSDNETYQSATGRSVIHVYKLAMIFSIFDIDFQKTVLNRTDYPLLVELPDIWVEEAIKIVETYLLPRMILVIEYSEKVDKNNRQQHVLDNLKLFGGVAKHSELLKRTKLDSVEFSKAIRTLIESEEIKIMDDNGKKIYCINTSDTGDVI